MQNRMLKSCIFTPKPLRKKESLGLVSIYILPLFEQILVKKNPRLSNNNRHRTVYIPHSWSPVLNLFGRGDLIS